MKEINKGDIWMTEVGIIQVCYEMMGGLVCKRAGIRFMTWVPSHLLMYKISK